MKPYDPAYHKAWYDNHKHLPSFIEDNNKRLMKWRTDKPRKYLLQLARERAKLFKLPFNLVEEDIEIPSVCPVFKTPFQYGTPYAASIDKIVPALGYVKGNIQVISRKANVMKQNASREELRKFAEWVLRE